jgi:hypothetical protein
MLEITRSQGKASVLQDLGRLHVVQECGNLRVKTVTTADI